MPETQEEVTLRDGSRVPAVAVMPVWLNIERLYSQATSDGAEALSAFLELYELHALATDKAHTVFGSYGDKLKARGLVTVDGAGGTYYYGMHDVVRSVVLSSVTVSADGQNITLQAPYGA